MKLLGVTFDSKLTFAPHLRDIATCILCRGSCMGETPRLCSDFDVDAKLYSIHSQPGLRPKLFRHNPLEPRTVFCRVAL